MRLKVLLAVCLVTGVVPAHAAGGLTDVGRNEHNYTLKLDLLTFVVGAWQGDANFTISGCPRPECFHLSGSVLFQNRNGAPEAFFPIPGLRCDLHFEEVLHKGMDSGDYRVTMVSRAPRGCASLPGDLTGVFKEIPKSVGPVTTLSRARKVEQGFTIRASLLSAKVPKPLRLGRRGCGVMSDRHAFEATVRARLETWRQLLTTQVGEPRASADRAAPGVGHRSV
jgi:hypothetical protein